MRRKVILFAPRLSRSSRIVAPMVLFWAGGELGTRGIRAMDAEPCIRPLRADDIPAVAELLASLARTFFLAELSPDGQDLFLTKNSAAAIEQFVAAGFRYHVAVLGSQVVGFVGVRDNQHLYHLF